MITIDNVNKKYGDKKILDRINLDIQPGELVFIVGSSGAGKSTLLNLIGGLDTVSSGNIYCDNMDISIDLPQYRAERIGFIFQDFNLISGLSVTKNIELALFYSHKKSKTIRREIEHLGMKDSNQTVETMSWVFLLI